MTEEINQTRLTELADDLIAAARRAGADSADAIILQNRALAVECRLGAVEEVTHSETDDIGLRVLVGQRQAMISSNRPDRAEFDALAERAVAMAKASPADPYAGLADRECLATDLVELDMDDPTEPSAEQLRELALACEESGRAVDGVTNSDGASAGWSRGGMVLVTSTGFTGGYLRSHFSISASMIAGEGDMMERDYEYEVAAYASDLPDASWIGAQAGKRVVRRLGARKLESGQQSIIFEPRVSASLISHLSAAIKGPAIARRSSFLLDKVGAQLFGRGINIRDEPLRPRALGSRPFDGEGLPCTSHLLIDDGILTGWLLDCASARELGLSPTGHARRAIGGPPFPGVSNLEMDAGQKAPQDLISGVDSGIFVTELIGSGVNMVTGDYSRGAAGFRIEQGELTTPVSEVTIAGNLLDMFANMQPANDLQRRRSVNAPTILVEGMTVGGR